MSNNLEVVPLIAYSDPPLRNIVREIVTSEYSIGNAPSELSIVNKTSARPSGARPEDPAKITSSIFPPRKLFAPCSPRTQAIASTTLDFPEPFGPTTAVIPCSKFRVVEDANDLKPRIVRLFRYTRIFLEVSLVRGRGHRRWNCLRPVYLLPLNSLDLGREIRTLTRIAIH